MEVKFHNVNEGEKPTIVVIYATYKGKTVLCQHKNRETWEIPGGHIENGETPEEAAKRELKEETGAIEFEIKQICKYSFGEEKKVYSIMYKANIIKIGNLPQSEIKKIDFFDKFPENLTYPEIYEKLFTKIGE